MKKLFISIKDFIKKRSIVTIALMFIVLASSFFAVSLFGVSNSSFCYLERSCHNLQDNFGSFTHIKYFLGDESEGRIKSIISDVNDFNSYRIKEIDRTASYVLDEEFQIEYNENLYNSSDIIYVDYYSQYFTTNRMMLVNKHFSSEDFYNDDTIFISRGLLNTIEGLSINDAVGKTIRLSFDVEKEYVIKGVVDTDNINCSGSHFKKLFNDKFVMLNSTHIYDYHFTDLFLTTDNYYFADDLCEFEKKLDKSYLQYDAIDMQATYIDSDNAMFLSSVFRMSRYSSISILFSVLTILALLILSILIVFLIFVYDFNNHSVLEKIAAFFSMFTWSFVPMTVSLFAMSKAMFMSRITISLLIAFAAVSLFALLWRYSFFKSSIDESEVEDEK